MPTTSDDRSINLSVQLDQSSVQAIQSSLSGIKDNLVAMGGEAAKNSDFVKTLSDNLEGLGKLDSTYKLIQNFADLSKETGNTRVSLEGLRTALEQVGASKDEIDAATESLIHMQEASSATEENLSVSGSGVRGIRRAGSELRALGAPQQFTETITKLGDVAMLMKEGGELEKGLGSFKDALMADADALVPILAIAAPVAAGFIALSISLGDTKTKTDEAIKQLEDYNKAVADLTTEQAQKELEKAKKAADDAYRNYADQQNILVSAGQQFGDNLAGHFRAGLAQIQGQLTGGNTITELEASTAKAKKAYEDAQANVDAFNTALKNNAFSANDAAAAEAKLQAERDKAADAAIAWAGQVANLERGTSTKAIQDKIDTDKAEVDAIMQVINTTGLSAAEHEKLSARLTELYKQENDLSGPIMDHVKANEELAKQEQLQKTALAELTKAGDAAKAGIQQLSDNLTKFQENTATIVADRQAQEKEQESTYQDQRKQKSADFYANLDTQETDFYANEDAKRAKLYESAQNTLDKTQQNISKAEESFQLSQIQKSIDLAANIDKILRDSRENELDAASHLDARRVAAEERNAHKQITDAELNYNKTKQRDEENNALKIADMQKAAQEQHDLAIKNGEETIANEEAQHERQKELAVARFEEGLKRADDQEKLRIKKQEEAWKKQDDARDKNFEDQQNKLAEHLQRTLNQQVIGQNMQLNGAQNFMTNLQTVLDAGYSQVITNIQNQSNAAVAQMQQQQQITQQNQITQPAQVTQPALSNSGGGGGWFGGLGSALSGIGSWLGFAPGGNPPLNQPVWVGEHGPELVKFRSPAQVYNHNDSMAMMGAQKGTTNIYINGGKISGSSANKQMIKDTLTQVIQELANG